MLRTFLETATVVGEGDSVQFLDTLVFPGSSAVELSDEES